MLSKQVLPLLALLAMSIFTLVAAVNKEDPGIYPQRYVKDAYGRHAIYHGVNIVYKLRPYYPNDERWDDQNSLTDKDIEDLQSWGFNQVRLGVMWEAVETAPGVYNETYLGIIEDIINRLGKAGIYTLIDGHQDVISRMTCGEGMPYFYAQDVLNNDTLKHCFGKYTDLLLYPLFRATGLCQSIDKYDMIKDDNGVPLLSQCLKVQYYHYYYTLESFILYRALYNNDMGMQDKYVAYWEKVAESLGKNKYVIGIDPVNEPFPSFNSVEDFLKNIWPNAGNFDKNDLQPLYKRIYDVYYKHSQNTSMWFEPGQVPDEIGLTPDYNWVFTAGFTNPPGAKKGSSNHVLNDHTYCCQLGGSVCAATGEATTVDPEKCRAWHEKRLNVRSTDAESLGIPLAITEFGACLDSDYCVREITQVTEASDKKLASWAYWEYKTFKDFTTISGDTSEGFYNFDGTLQWRKVKALSRTYIKYAQGEIKSMEFNSTSGNFNAIVKVDFSIQEPTVVYAHKSDRFMNTTWYPNDYEVKLTDLNSTQAPVILNANSSEPNHFHFSAQNFAQEDKHYLQIELFPKEKGIDDVESTLL